MSALRVHAGWVSVSTAVAVPAGACAALVRAPATSTPMATSVIGAKRFVAFIFRPPVRDTLSSRRGQYGVRFLEKRPTAGAFFKESDPNRQLLTRGARRKADGEVRRAPELHVRARAVAHRHDLPVAQLVAPQLTVESRGVHRRTHLRDRVRELAPIRRERGRRTGV